MVETPQRLGFKSYEDIVFSYKGPTLCHRFPQLSFGMLDDFTSKVSFLATSLIVVSLFVRGYFSLRGDPMVKSLPSYLRLT
jgi:hypothetical protein